MTPPVTTVAEAPPAIAPEGVQPGDGAEVPAPFAPEPSSVDVSLDFAETEDDDAESFPVEVSEPGAAVTESLDVPVDVAELASSPRAASPPGAADIAVDLSNLPSSPLASDELRARAAAGTGPVGDSFDVIVPEGRSGLPRSRVVAIGIGAALLLAVVALVAFLVGRGEREAAANGGDAASSAERTVLAAEAERPASPIEEATEAVEPSAPEATEAGSSEADSPTRARRPRRPAAPGATPAAPPPAPEPAAETAVAAPAATGTVNIYSVPPADVYVDGRRIGVTPKQVTLPVGMHTIVVEDPALGRQSVQVDVQAKKQHSVNLTLE